MYADSQTTALTGHAAQLLRQFNEAAMVGPTVHPADLAEAFQGLICATERLPNTLRHLSGHLLSTQRERTLMDPRGRDTDELTERVRQRCHDVADALSPLVAKLKEVHTLVTGLSVAGTSGEEAEIVIPSQHEDLGPSLLRQVATDGM